MGAWGDVVWRGHSNVRLIVVMTLLYSLASSIWSDTALAAFLLGKTGSKTAVGSVEAAGGLAQLVTALPVGYLADKFGKAKLCKVGTSLSLIGPVVIAFAIFDSAWTRRSFILFLVGIIVEGLINGIIWGPLQALFADSVRTGDRSIAYAWIQAAYLTGSIAGPLCTIVFFLSTADRWNTHELAILIGTGLALTAPPAAMQYFLTEANVDEDEKKRKTKKTKASVNDDDDNGALKPLLDSADEYNDNDRDTANSSGDEGLMADGDDEGDGMTQASRASAVRDEESPLLSDIVKGTDVSFPSSMSPSSDSGTKSLRHRFGWMIPVIIFVNDVVVAFGSGMTIKFFPLWWKDDNHMSPIAVQFIYVLSPLGIIVAGYVSVWLSKRIGRVQTCMLLRTLGCTAMVLLVHLFHRGANKFFVLVPIYLVRTASMNGVYPIMESVLMDTVPADTRARWKSLDSISAFGWCGSAALGGFLADKYDYTVTFLITAAIQFFGSVVLTAPLLLLVPRFESSAAANSETHRLASSDNGTKSDAPVGAAEA